jgi:uncharacterized membrane-anchored protein YhcB (DUF1043 family)
MNILWFYISPNELGFWSGVIGSALSTIGAIIAALVAAAITFRHERKKASGEKLAIYSRACLRAEADLNNLLTMSLANTRLVKGGVDHIKKGETMANLPRVTPIDRELFADFRNSQLINHWLSLSQATNMVNNLVADYRQYYTKVSDEVHAALMHKEQPDAKVVKWDYETLAGFGGAVSRATDALIEQSFDTYALISVHANDGNIRFKKFSQLYEFEASEDQLKVEREKLVKHFNPDDMFLDVN